MKLNKFADLTFEEFSQLMLMDPQHCSATQEGVARHGTINAEPPSSMDWRSKGAVTHVKNQVSFKFTDLSLCLDVLRNHVCPCMCRENVAAVGPSPPRAASSLIISLKLDN